jgi:hypothetical protein
MPADGIGAADRKEGAETSVRRRFWAAYALILGAERKAQGERPRDYKFSTLSKLASASAPRYLPKEIVAGAR